MKVFISGANGFVGNYLSHYLEDQEFSVVRGTRSLEREGDVKYGSLENWHNFEFWQESLRNVDAIVHCAARVHVMSDSSANPLDSFREINVEATKVLATEALKAEVSKFIYLSSIKVNGQATEDGERFSSQDIVNPEDPYGRSKWEAELALKEIFKETATQLIIIRPPLIYGPCAKGNIQRLLKLIKFFPILPFGGISNKRSMVSLSNLSQCIALSLRNKGVLSQDTFLVSDDLDLSTTELIRLLAQSKGRKLFLLPISPTIIRFLLQSLGKKEIADRLLGDLQIDCSHTQKALNWQPSKDHITMFKSL